MPAAISVDALLERNGVAYETLRRDPRRSRAGNEPCAVPGDRVVKARLLVDAGRHAVAVIPTNRRLDLAALNQEFGRRFRLGSPADRARLFPGLPAHAMLPAAIDQQVEIFVDQSLVGLREIAFETPDARTLLRIEGEAFTDLFDGAWCGRISNAH